MYITENSHGFQFITGNYQRKIVFFSLEMSLDIYDLFSEIRG